MSNRSGDSPEEDTLSIPSELELSEGDDDILENWRENLHKSEWRPPSPAADATLWRYIDFTQLVSILEREAIWFSNVSSFTDPYEGIWQTYDDSTEKDNVEGFVERSFARNNLIYVNCWHQNEYESAALWEQHTEGENGVAIKTNVLNLDNSIKSDIESLCSGSVRYINYEMTDIPRSNSISPAFHKRNSFEHENEYRVAFWDEDQVGKAFASIAEDIEFQPKTGYYIDVDLDQLINRIHIAPTADDWFFELVKDVVRSSDWEFDLVKSDLYDDPIE